MGEAIVFTSGKGGVGKTTTIANIGAGLSLLEKKVIMLDTDMGLRNLDVVMGLEDRINYNLMDLLDQKCRLKQALIKDSRYPNLYMIPASLNCFNLKDYEQAFQKLVRILKKEFDYCLIDCPAGIDSGFSFATGCADRLVIVTTPQLSAISDATRVVKLLESRHFYNLDLLINQINERLIKKQDSLNISDIEDVIGFASIGQIPWDDKVAISQNRGIPVVSMRSKAGRAYLNAARKLLRQLATPVDLNKDNDTIPLMEKEVSL